MKKIWIVILVLLILGTIGVWFYQKNKNKNVQPQHVTTRVQKNTIISSVAASGTVSSSNYTSISSQSSGIVKRLFVKDGDIVKKGDRLLEIELDQSGKQAEAKAYSSYLAAKNSLDDANINKMTLNNNLNQAHISATTTDQSKLSLQKALESAKAAVKQAEIDYANTKDNKKLSWSYREKARLSLVAAQEGLKLAQAQYDSVDATIEKSNEDINIAEEKFNNSEAQIKKAEADLRSAWLSYQLTSPAIIATMSGKISGLSVFEGMTIGSQSNSSSTSTSSQKLLVISNPQNPLVSVNVSESDIPKIKIDQKATITVDALKDKSYTGKVLTIDRVGSVSSGVTTYPIVVKFDVLADEVLPNMSTNVDIIIDLKNNVLSVPSSAIHKNNEQNTVQVMNNGNPEQRNVELGLSSSTDIEILSGLSEGEEIITSTINQSKTNTSTGSQSIFSGIRAGGGLGSSGAVRRETNR